MPYGCLFTERSLQFFLPGKPLSKGMQDGSKKGVRHPKNQHARRDEYVNLIKMQLKAAMFEQQYIPQEDDAVYVIITINLRPTYNDGKEAKALQLKGQIMPIRAPSIPRHLEFVKRALKQLGIIKNDNQIVGVTVVKRFVPQAKEGLDVLIGIPKTWRELNHDLRNA